MNKFQELKEAIAAADDDAVKFYDKKNNAAGTRLRLALMKVKTLAQEARNEVTALKSK